MKTKLDYFWLLKKAFLANDIATRHSGQDAHFFP
jgi:hypothetical protein